MKWVDDIHSKAHILQSQLEVIRASAVKFGFDPALAVRPIQDQIDAIYAIEFPLARALDESDLVVHFSGPAVDDHTPMLSTLEGIFSNLRAQIFSVAKAVAGLDEDQKLSGKDVELSLSALAPGSIYVGLKAEPSVDRNGQQRLAGQEDPILLATKSAMRSIGVLSRYLDENAPEAIAEVPDARVRDAALVAVARIAPSKRSGINRVTVVGDLGQSGGQSGAILTPKLRTELRRQLTSDRTHDMGLNSAPTTSTLSGEIREIDLDFNRFDLRRIAEFPETSVRCVLAAGTEISLAQLAGARVRVTGLVSDGASTAPRLMRVVSVQVLGQSPSPIQDHIEFLE